jgi:predicted nucleic acid-binding protein
MYLIFIKGIILIHIVLDTNILHNDGIHSIKIKKLKKLIDVNFITLYIPEIVKREYITKMYDKLELELNNATLKENRRYFEYDTHDTKNKIALIDKTICKKREHLNTVSENT